MSSCFCGDSDCLNRFAFILQIQLLHIKKMLLHLILKKMLLHLILIVNIGVLKLYSTIQ